MKKLIFALLLTGIFNLQAQGQSDGTQKNAPYRLKAYLSDHIAEKAFLQFDKPYYAAGDTIYFKAYVTLGEDHRLSNLSGVLHVDLANTNNKIDQSIKLQLNNGLAAGDFALPDSLPNGNYTIRAYTQWMRNDGDAAFFYKTIPIGSSINKIPESNTKHIPAAYNKADIQFFPEGGILVTGIKSKVAFKAIAPGGLGANVKGIIVDNNNSTICSFRSTHLGMGYFYLQPEEGKTYKARLTYTDGTEGIVDLPLPEAKGIILLVNNDSIPQASVKIEASNSYCRENKNSEYTLLIYSGNTATTVKCKLDSPVIALTILKRRLHTGIATVTLFSPTGEPLCERLIFVQNYDQLKLDINAGKDSYTKREKVTAKLNAANRAGNPAEGHFSVAVVNENMAPTDENTENTIVSNLLLTSDLKGYVEQPNYYFADTSANARKNLDILMLTQGYRRFTWKQVLDNNNPPVAYQPEKGLEISGQVKNLLGKPINKGTVTLLASKGGQLLSSVSDDNGVFHFQNLVFTDTTHFVLSAVNANGKNSTKMTYFTDKNLPVVNQSQPAPEILDTALVSLIKNDKLQQDELVKYGHLKGIMLKEVKIKSFKLGDDYRTQSLAGAGFADQVMHADEIERVQGPLGTSLNGRLHGVNFVRLGMGRIVPMLTVNSMMGVGNNLPAPMLIVVDGTEGADINDLSANDVETVELLKSANASIYGMSGAGGVIVITTKQGGGLKTKDISSIGILPIAPMGFYKAREFYSPKYDNATAITAQRDLRSTIYWKPEIVTDKDGDASFEYYNADGTGTYRVVIEGIDDKGNLGRQVYRYKVE
jgi:TonB-dependent SusC/RagA subfamily outer membrane receptor